MKCPYHKESENFCMLTLDDCDQKNHTICVVYNKEEFIEIERFCKKAHKERRHSFNKFKKVDKM
jgi:hypothetical protein